jgi:hypothetical protein
MAVRAAVRSAARPALMVLERLRHRVEDAALYGAAVSGDARRAARWLRRSAMTRDAAHGGTRHVARGPLPPIVILARSAFTDDALLVAAELGHDEVTLLRREAFKALARAFLPADVGDLNYRSAGASAMVAMDAYRAFLRELWTEFDPTGACRLVLTANTCYSAEVELGGALDELGIPFVALHKENLKSPGHARQWLPIYAQRRSAFHGARVLVHNRAELELQVAGGVAPAERIDVVGLARLDAAHRHRRATAGRSIDGPVVVASFLPGEIRPRLSGFSGTEPRLGLPVPDAEVHPYDFVGASIELHRAAVLIARRRPDVEVIVKGKGLERHRRWIPRLIAHVAGPAGAPANLTLRFAGDALRLTCEASVVVGFNTTMVLEALAAGRPAVHLVAEEALGPAADFVIGLGSAAPAAHSGEEAATIVGQLLDGDARVPDELAPSVQAVLQEWAGNPDGRATQRTAAVLAPLLTPPSS